MNEHDRALARSAKVPFGLKIGYASGAILDAAISHTLGVFLLFYITAVCGLPGALAGIALASGMIVDALLDPAIGSLSDSWKSRFGRRVPFMCLGLPLVAAFYVMIFSLPTGLDTWVLFGCVMALSIGMRVSVSIFNVPYTALTAELTEDYAERSSISAWRWAMGIFGTLIALVLGFTVFFSGPEGTMNKGAYTPFAATIALIVIVGCGLAIWAAIKTQGRQHLPPESDDKLHQRVFNELREAFANRSFTILVSSAVMFFTALGAHSALGLHINTYFWRLEPGQVQMATLATFVGLLFGAPLAGPLLQKLEKRTVVMIGMGGLAASGCLPALLRLAGLFPFQGATLAYVLTGILFCGGVMMASAAISYGAMIADATDEHEKLFGARREGLFFAGWSFAAKASGGLGSLVAGVVLQLSGFPSGIVEGGAAAQIDASALVVLALLYAGGSGALYAAAITVLRSYHLGAAQHQKIIAELNERRAKVAAEAAAG